MGKLIDLTGRKFDRLTVLRRAKNSASDQAQWLCLCECGAEKVVRGNHLTRRLVKSCGCLRDQKTSERRKKHGMGNNQNRFYRIWAGMNQRCKNPNNPSFIDYGGRGIAICQRWNSFECFRDDMHDSYLNHAAKYGAKNTTIERKNVNGNYEPKNVVWATLQEQVLNKRDVLVTDGVRKTTSGAWQARISRYGTKRTKSFLSKEKAIQWRKEQEIGDNNGL